ncbi:MAG: hypothetical protein K0S94_2904 [Nitrospira sp.]|nr:hypothetical protein [Nitrospira sp.]
MTGSTLKRLRFAFGRFRLGLHVARSRVIRGLLKAGLRCPQCKGKGFVINCEIEGFIAEVGLPAYYAATMLAHRADQQGGAISIPLSAWGKVGLDNYHTTVFLGEIVDAWPVWECDLCSTTSHQHITERAFEKAQRVAIDAEKPPT